MLTERQEKWIFIISVSLTAIFISLAVLRRLEVIQFSWIWVFSPLWLPWATVLTGKFFLKLLERRHR